MIKVLEIISIKLFYDLIEPININIADIIVINRQLIITIKIYI